MNPQEMDGLEDREVQSSIHLAVGNGRSIDKLNMRVVQVNLPELLEHPVRLQNRPDHGDGTSTELNAPVVSSKLVNDS